MTLQVTSARYVPARPPDVRRGLLGWADVTINATLVIRGVAVRRTRGGRYVVSFPAPALRRGGGRAVVHPIDRVAHADLERQILAELRRQRRLAS